MSEAVRYRVAEGVSYERVGNEVVVVSVQRGVYFGLDEVASIIWTTLAGGHGIDQAVEAVIEEYDVDPKRARYDAIEIIDRWLRENLLVAPGEGQ